MFGGLWHIKHVSNFQNQNAIVVHDLCGIEVDTASLRSGIRISVESKLWTRMECGASVPRYAIYS